LLVTGSIGIDTVETPWGKVQDVLGGSAVYFAYAASFFVSPVRLVGVVGGDCSDEFLRPLRQNARIDLAGLEVRPASKTFRWHGRYQADVNCRETVAVDLNVLAEQGPKVPPGFRDSQYVFLANSHPALQWELLNQLDSPVLVVADTMDLWIDTQKPALIRLLENLDGLVLNDAEAKALTGRSNVVEAGLAVGEMVRRFVVVKKGEHGSLLFAGGKVYPMPGYPTTRVVDPTGAGDCFAGAMMGYLAATDRLDATNLRTAIACGTVTASFGLEDFSLNRLLWTTREQIDARMNELREMMGF
jgi:sugar/nucleoside kinase (ribokinase family)